MLVPLAFVLGLLLPARSALALDSLAVHAELGGSADASNELYFEDAYTDTTFLGRRLHGTPESRFAGIAALDVSGRSGALEFGFRPELALGTQLTRAATLLRLRLRSEGGWTVTLEPRAEYVRDLSFDLERRQVLVATRARARRLMGAAGEDALDLRAAGELLDTPRSTDPFLLAHRLATAGLGWDHEPLFGTSWSARWDGTLRTFPDSVERDHLEHRLEGTLRQDFDGGHSLGLDADVTRRGTLRTVADSRDRFIEASAELRGLVRLPGAYSLRGSVLADLYRYDQPDSALDFDYHVERLRLTLRRELAGGAVSLGVGPRAEFLAAPWNPAERYAEVAGELELEWLAGGRWWSFEPATGRRSYAESEAGGSTDPAALHSSYFFGELQVLGDQPLPAGLRLRLTLDGRLESHDDPTQDSRGFYFSMDLRRLF